MVQQTQGSIKINYDLEDEISQNVFAMDTIQFKLCPFYNQDTLAFKGVYWVPGSYITE